MVAIVEQLLSRYPLISDQVEPMELKVILRQLEAALTQTEAGGVVELGCYAGTTSLFIRRILNELAASREFHVYDSFAGLPDKTAADVSPAGEQFVAGELSVSKKDFIHNFKKAGLIPPTIHKGWFADLSSDDLPENISFAFLDGDYYESIMDSLKLVWPKLVLGSVVVVDDYANEALPGAARAVNEWLKTHPAHLRVERSLAVLRPTD